MPIRRRPRTGRRNKQSCRAAGQPRTDHICPSQSAVLFPKPVDGQGQSGHSGGTSVPGYFSTIRRLNIRNRASGKKDGEAVSEETFSPSFYSARDSSRSVDCMQAAFTLFHLYRNRLVDKKRQTCSKTSLSLFLAERVGFEPTVP